MIQPPTYDRQAQCRFNFDCLPNQVCREGKCEAFDPCEAGAVRNCGNNAGIPGLCSGGKQICENGSWGPCVYPSTSKEVCDGKDNDCDGQIDEDFPEKNKFCRVLDKKGPCSRGEFRACVRGSKVCLATSEARAEGPNYFNCSDGIDNDCDGFTDDAENDGCKKCTTGDTQPCYPFGQGINDPTLKFKPCKRGTQKCVDGKWSTCEGHVVPRGEICDNKIDDDCDGIADDNCEDKNKCKPLGSRRPCYEGKTGTDNIGLCKAGLQTCQPDGKWSTCVGQVLPVPEVCSDGKDNDCNGKVDDCSTSCSRGEKRSCYSGPPTTRKKGQCKDGTQTCNEVGVWGPCKGEVLPSTQLCNSGVDSNCDGIPNNCLATELIIGSADVANAKMLQGMSLRTYSITRLFKSGHAVGVTALASSKSGQNFTSVDTAGRLLSWNRSEKVVWNQSAHRGNVNAIAYSPSGNFLATSGGTDLQTRLWQASSGLPAPLFQAHRLPVWGLAFSPNGLTLATASADSTLKLWDLSGRVPVNSKTLSGVHTGDVFSLSYHTSGGYIASAGRDGKVVLWNLLSNARSVVFTNPASSMNVVTFSVNGKRLAFAGDNGLVYVYNFVGGKPTLYKTLKNPGNQKITALRFHLDGESIALGDSKGFLRMWILQTGRLVINAQVAKAQITDLLFLP